MRRLLFAAGAALVVLGVLYGLFFWPVAHWFEYYTGSAPESSPWYGFFSGFGSIVLPPVLTVSGIGLLAWWHHTCHDCNCLRWARFQSSQGYKLCKRHVQLPSSGVNTPHHQDHLS